MSSRSKGLLGKGGRSLCGKPVDIHFLTDYLYMENHEAILISTIVYKTFCVFKNNIILR